MSKKALQWCLFYCLLVFSALPGLVELASESGAFRVVRAGPALYIALAASAALCSYRLRKPMWALLFGTAITASVTGALMTQALHSRTHTFIGDMFMGGRTTGPAFVPFVNGDSAAELAYLKQGAQSFNANQPLRAPEGGFLAPARPAGAKESFSTLRFVSVKDSTEARKAWNREWQTQDQEQKRLAAFPGPITWDPTPGAFEWIAVSSGFGALLGLLGLWRQK